MAKEQGVKVVARNRKARHDYLIEETIEAGLVVRELKLRGMARRILVVAPKGLVRQWQAEMRLHFGERFRLIDPAELAALADRVGALLTTSGVAAGTFADEAYDLGICGGFATPLAAELVTAADLVVAWGCSLTSWTTRHGRLLGARTTLVQVDDDPAAIGGRRPVKKYNCVDIAACHLAEAGVIREQDGLEGLRALFRGDNGPVDAVGGIVGDLHQQEYLREAVVLAGDTLGQPPGFVTMQGDGNVVIYRADGVPWRPRIQSYDSTFGVEATDAITVHKDSVASTIASAPAVPTFDDTKNWWFLADSHATTGAHVGRYQPGWVGVQVPKTGTTVTVNVRDTYPTTFLGIIGITSMTVTGNGQARITRSVEGVEQ